MGTLGPCPIELLPTELSRLYMLDASSRGGSSTVRSWSGVGGEKGGNRKHGEGGCT